jgi:thioredoxin-like negative regulator of GroEL
MLDSYRMKKGRNSTSVGFYVMLIALFLVAVIILGYMKPLEYFSNGPTLEYFYMKTCQHCENFSPIWDEVVDKIKKDKINVKPVKYDLNANGKKRADEFEIHSAPTIYYVDGAKKVMYDGPRSVEGITAFVKSQTS